MFKLERMEGKQRFYFPAKWCPLTGAKGAAAFRKVEELLASDEASRRYYMVALAYGISLEEGEKILNANALEAYRKGEAGEVEDEVIYFDNLLNGHRQKFLEKYGFCLCKGANCPKGTFYTYLKNYCTCYFHCGGIIFPEGSTFRVYSYPKIIYDFMYIPHGKSPNEGSMEVEVEYVTKEEAEKEEAPEELVSALPDEDLHNPNDEEEEAEEEPNQAEETPLKESSDE